ncbi:MAG: ASCH domain-containing protein [Gammaproteobacteria bacterium]|nr:ASCH domain-containing protein [Gammaproteobacteria bacterium]
MTYLPPGCTPPDPAELDNFWTHARQALPKANLPPHYSVRWIGLDNESTEQVLNLIRAGDKTGTYTLPWIVAQTTHPTPAAGDVIILIDFGGHPRLIVRLTEIEEVAFGAVTATHTAGDGTPRRDLAVWKPLHTNYWNAMLAEHGLAVSDDMPVWVEKFELLN